MSDKEKLERMKKLADAMYTTAQYLTTDASGLRKAMNEYHKFIIYEYNKQEPVSDDLEQASEEYRRETWNEAHKNGFLDNYPSPSIKTAFKVGSGWQKEQMTKNAVEVEVFDDWQYGKDADSIAQPAIKVRCPKLKIGEKVKVIIVKD